MPIIPLPERASLEQLRKRARELQRAVRSNQPAALDLVAEHAPHHRHRSAAFSLDAAQLVIARQHGFPSWPLLRQHLDVGSAPTGRDGEPVVLTPENRYRLRRNWASPQNIRRCAEAATDAHTDPSDWRPLLTTRYRHVTVIAFTTSNGAVFAELTPTSVAISAPQAVPPAPAGAAVTFHTALGTVAGLVSPEVRSLSVERVADRRAREGTIVTDGVFVVPNAFVLGSPGVILRINGADVGDIVADTELPPRTGAVVDRPAVGPGFRSPAEQAFTARLVAADTPPVVDPELWQRGVSAALTAAERLQLGRYGNLLSWYIDGTQPAPFVFDFESQDGPLQEFAAVGATVAATRLYYDFTDNGSGHIAVVGLVRDDRVAAIRLQRAGEPDMPARIAGGTFLIHGAELTDLREDGRVTAVLQTLDEHGHILETVPYQQAPPGSAIPERGGA